MLATLLRPTGGRALVAGHDVVSEAAAVRRSIGVALQDAAIDPYMTGRELLHLQAVLHGFHRAVGHARAVELLERVDLVAAADRRVGTYSGGMRRRLDLALALVHEPEVLFLDEPTTGLDPISRLTLWEEVRRLNGEGTTVFLTTQYLEEADQLAGRVGIIDGGRIVAEGTPSELKAQVGDPTLNITLAHPEDARRRRARPCGRWASRCRPARAAWRCGCPTGAAALPAVGAGARPGGRGGRRPRPGPADPRRRLRRQDRAAPRGRVDRRAGGRAGTLAGVTLALRQTGALAWRSVLGTLRTPQALVPEPVLPARPDGDLHRLVRQRARDDPRLPAGAQLPRLRARRRRDPGHPDRGHERRRRVRPGHRGRVLRPAGGLAGLARSRSSPAAWAAAWPWR